MPKCIVCNKSVYPMDPQINLDGTIFHKPCAKCADCSCQITISNFTKGSQDGQTILLCKTHYFKRFKEGGSYVGGEKYQVKASRDVQASSRRSSTNGEVVASSPVTVPPASTEQQGQEAPTSGSVRDRIANIRVTEKPKTDANAQSSSRRSSFEVSRSRSSDGQSKQTDNSHKGVVPTAVAASTTTGTISTPSSLPASPEKTIAPAPVAVEPTPAPVAVEPTPAPVAVEPTPAPVVVEEVPVAVVAEVKEEEDKPVDVTVPPPVPPVEETADVVVTPDVAAAVQEAPEETAVEAATAVEDESVIDASPENGVSTPYIAPVAVSAIEENAEKSDVKVEEESAVVEETATAAEESN